MTLRSTLQGAIRPSTTRSTAALWAKSLLNAVVFFGVFMVALPWLADIVLPLELGLPRWLRIWLAGLMASSGVAGWLACLDTFSRVGRGTPLAADAPSQLVTGGLFRVVRNPIMACELLVVWAGALYLATLGPLLYAAALSVLAHVLVVRIEEPELLERFGPLYNDYCREVPRWLPRLRAAA
jgi:protein-S-isoprenylcysteine O-methyltransferase Ste14